MPRERFIVIGGGPAGLTAGYELARAGHSAIVLEKDRVVGGLARTENYRGYLFDMGGHRFFSKSDAVNRMWREVLAADFLRRSRLSRIYYRNRFFQYPLRLRNVIRGLGGVESVRILASYLLWSAFPRRVERSFEDWVCNRFGQRLYETFFKVYTEKVWGIPCTELKAEWAAQRIKSLSLWSVASSMFFKPKAVIKSLIDAFDYPRRGPGMMWNAVADQIRDAGGEVRLESGVSTIHSQGQRITSVSVRHGDREEVIAGTQFISSMPITELVARMSPSPPADVLESARRLKYRGLIVVGLIVAHPELFPDNWIYVHSPNVRVGRIQNVKNWSPEMVPDASKTSLALEYFCDEGDELWNRGDHDLIELARRELGIIGLAQGSEVEDGKVFRVPKAYPVYDADYRPHLDRLRNFIEQFRNLQTIGRNGLHRYNNQDHAMLTGMIAVRNALYGERHDLWSVNEDQEYHEELRPADPCLARSPVFAADRPAEACGSLPADCR